MTFFFIFFDWRHFMCRFCVYGLFVFVRCYPSVCVYGPGKGVTGMPLFRQGIDMAQRPWRLLWDVVKHPYHRQSLPPATTTNTPPYVGLSGCHPVPGCWRQPQRYQQSEGWDRVMNLRQQQQRIKPRWSMLAIPETDAGQYLFLLPQNCLTRLRQCFAFRGKWKTIIMSCDWCWMLLGLNLSKTEKKSKVSYFRCFLWL